MSESFLFVDDITVAYGRTTVLRRLSLRANRGEIIAIRGSNGSGKSTLLRAIIGAIPLASGDISIGDGAVRGKSVDVVIRSLRVAYLPQDRRGIPGLTVAANLTLAGWMAGSYASAVRAASAILDREGFAQLRATKHLQTSSLSGGQRLLLALATIEMGRGSLILLDEPFAGADPDARVAVSGAVQRWALDGRCVLIVDHGDCLDRPLREVLIEGGCVASDRVVHVQSSEPPRVV